MKLKLLTFFIVMLTATAASFSLGGMFKDDSGTVALVKLSGSITPTSSGFGGGGITPEEVRDLNQRVRNGGYDAVIYEINSGGGAVVASKEIKRSIESMKVPTVCRFRDISASGGYLIATGCDRIVADSATLTGSIGVTSSYLQFSGALERFGVQYINVTAGKYKGLGSPFSNATEKEKEILKGMALNIQDEFVGMVDENRNLTEEQIAEVETARVFLGDEAKDLDLVDRLGGRQAALESAEKMTDKDLRISEIKKQEDFSLLSLFLSSSDIGNFVGALGLGNSVGVPLEARY